MKDEMRSGHGQVSSQMERVLRVALCASGWDFFKVGLEKSQENKAMQLKAAVQEPPDTVAFIHPYRLMKTIAPHPGKSTTHM
jgi:hypothetical protein